MYADYKFLDQLFTNVIKHFKNQFRRQIISLTLFYRFIAGWYNDMVLEFRFLQQCENTTKLLCFLTVASSREKADMTSYD
jgi:hypothetical protein